MRQGLRRAAPALATGSTIVLTVALVALAIVRPIPVRGAAITLTTIATNFNFAVGIDHHEPTNKVVTSVHYPNGTPYNFELVASDGSREQFSAISGFLDEVKIATVRKGCCDGGFEVGELFTGTGVPGVIARIAPDGSSFQNPWVTLPGETGLMRGSLFQDRYCVCGGDLIVVTTSGGVWRVTSAGVATNLATLGTHLEGLTTVPNDPVKYGPWAGKILAGAEGQGRIYSIDCETKQVQFYTLGINPEDFEIIPANQNFFGVNYGGGKLMGAGPAQFASMVGDVLIAQESPGILWHVSWTGTAFVKENIAQVEQWEHITFSTAGLPDVLPIDPVDLSPATATNPLGTNHTVTATVVDPNNVIPAGRLFTFKVIAGPNTGQSSDPGECSANANCTTDASDQVSWTYTSNGAPGTDKIEACFVDDDCSLHCSTAKKKWADLRPPVASCTETVNPHGDNVPPAGSTTLPGPKGGQNDDGFYRLKAGDDFDPTPDIYVVDQGSGTVFGPFASGTTIKYTQAPGTTPSQTNIGSSSGQADAVDWHIKGTGDAIVYAVDDAGNTSKRLSCRVPPPPK